MKKTLHLFIFLFLTAVSYSQNIYVVKFGTLSGDQVKDLTDNGIIGKEWQTKTYELDENEKLYVDSHAISYNLIEYGIKVSSEDIKQDYDPDSKAETSKTGSNTTDYTIADLGTTYSNITISSALAGSVASRISYSWNIDHDYVSDVSVRCGTSNWNDGDLYISKTGDDLLDGYSETSASSRTTYPTNQSVNQQWTLVAIDHYAGDAGRIDRWDLTVYYTADPPTVTTSAASSITTSGATLKGSVNPGGLTSAYWFQYGLSTSYGSSTTTRGLTASTSATSVSEAISGLAANTTYNYRLVAQNNAGTTYGSNLTFKTLGNPPSATTNSASSITTRSAQLNGSVNPNGISTTYYFQHGTTTSYGTNTPSTSAGSGTSSVSVNAPVDYLTAGTTYHYRLVATNSVGTTYGSDVSFTTSSMSITMSAPSSNVTVTQGQSVTLTWSGSPSTGSVSLRRDNDNNFTNGSSGEANIAVALPYSGSYNWNTSSVPLGTYYVVAMITDGSSSRYSYAAGRVTICNPPTISYNPVSNLTGTSATLGGSINPNGAQTTAYIQYGLTTSYGTQTSSQTISAGFSPVSFSSAITGLTQGTTYHWRIVAVNSAGTTYGSDQSFTTLKKPTVTTASASSITARSAQLNGNVNPEGSATTYYFEYGTSTSYGTNTSSTSAGSGTSAVNVNATVDYLNAGTTYHYRIVATSSSGTSYGSDMTFTTTAMLISMSSPSTNISVIKGQSTTLTWTGSPTSGVVALRQDDDNNFTNGSIGEANIAIALPYTGSYSWNTSTLPLSSFYVAAYITDGSNIKYAYAAGKITIIKLPLAVTGGYPSLSSTTATVTGTVNPNNSTTTTWVEYGLSTSYGSSTSTQSVGSGTSDIATTYSLSGLTAGVTYHYRVVAQNAAGKSYGEDKVFSTFLLNITSPSSNITVVQGNNVTINWTGSPSSANVLLRRDNDNIWDNGGESSLAVLPASTATYNWNTAGVPLGTYYIAAMITDGINSAYTYAAGRVTIIKLPAVVTGGYPALSSTTATVTGTVNPNNSSTTTWVEYGLSTTYGSSTSTQSLGSGTSDISTTYSLSGLTAGVTYHYRVVAQNAAGKSYGEDKIFATFLLNITSPSSNITVIQGNNVTINWTGSPSSANVLLRRDNDNIWDNGGESSLAVLPASTATYSWNTAGVPLGTYYIAAMITDGINSANAYATGKVTIISAPVITTNAPLNITNNSAELSGTVNPNGGNTTVYIQYGATTGYGYQITGANVGAGFVATNYSGIMTGLNASSTYHCRIVASNAAGTCYGNDQTFVTKQNPVILNVPYISQGDANWCAPSSIAMLLKYYGITKYPKEIAATRNISSSVGLGMEEIKDYLLNNYGIGIVYTFETTRILGIPNWLILNQMKTFIINRISEGKPILFGSNEIQHAFLVTGYDEDNVYLNDPSGSCLQALGKLNVPEGYYQGELAGFKVTWQQFQEQLLGGTWGWDGILDMVTFGMIVIDDNRFVENSSKVTIQIPQGFSYDYKYRGTVNYVVPHYVLKNKEGNTERKLYYLWDGSEPYSGYLYLSMSTDYYNLDEDNIPDNVRYNATIFDSLQLGVIASNTANGIFNGKVRVLLTNLTSGENYTIKDLNIKLSPKSTNAYIPICGTSTNLQTSNPCLTALNDESNTANGIDDDFDGLIDENIIPQEFPMSTYPAGRYKLKVQLINANTNVIESTEEVCLNTDMTTDLDDKFMTQESDIAIYPNPAHDWINFTGDLDREFRVQVIDINGNKCIDRIVQSNNLDISTLTQGIYILIVNNQKYRFVKY